MYAPSHRDLARRVMYVLPPDVRTAVLEYVGGASSQELADLYDVPTPALTAPFAAIVAAPFQNEDKAFDTLRGASACIQAVMGSDKWTADKLADTYAAATGADAGTLRATLANDPRVGATSDTNFLLNLALAIPTAGMLGKVMKSSRLGWIATIGGLALQKLASAPSAPAATTLSRWQALGEAMDDLEGVNTLAAWSLAAHPSQGKTSAEWTEHLKKLVTEAPTLLFGIGTLLQSGIIPKAISGVRQMRGAMPALLPAGDPDLRDTGPSEVGDPDVEVARFLETVATAGAEQGSLARLIRRLQPSIAPMLAMGAGGPMGLAALAASGGGAKKSAPGVPPAHQVDRLVHTARSGALNGPDGTVDPSRLGELIAALEKERAEQPEEEEPA